MDKSTLTRLAREAREIAREAGGITTPLVQLVLSELITDERKRERGITPVFSRRSPVSISIVYGENLADIKQRARDLAGMPDGTVTVNDKLQRSMNADPEGAYYASVTVTPAQPDDDLFTEEELKRALNDISLMNEDAFIRRVITQVRKNRAYDA